MNVVQKLIDERRALEAQMYGKSIEIFTVLGLPDEARTALREMNAVVLARHAVRESECFFDQMGEAAAKAGREDAKVGATNHD